MASMLKSPKRTKLSSSYSDCFIFFSGALWAFFMAWALGTMVNPLNSLYTLIIGSSQKHCCGNPLHDPPEPTYFDDPSLSYSMLKPMKNWDQKRKKWLDTHPCFAGRKNRMLLVTGSQPTPCKNPNGDHLLLRLFKNKVDYCRTHDIDVFYNNVFLDPKINSVWSKLPIIKAAMISHPEAEWMWWLDSDAIFTDMEFKLPMDKYKNHNLVIHGWPDMIFEKKSWVGANTGAFLLRNCQWTMDFLNEWISMGPQTVKFSEWGQIISKTLTDKLFPVADDQSAFIYLLLTQKNKWGDKIFLEYDYLLESYWLEIVRELEDYIDKYLQTEMEDGRLRRRHGEKVSGFYGELRDKYLKRKDGKNWRRPFVTHFTGCQPCNGQHNPEYSAESCQNGMERALNFADNQILRKFGFVHQNLSSSSVSLLPFDSPFY
ncbi:Glycosyltransferase 34 [Dillenia turbinata]|uniref:Glycosyltransferase 34 n=1 Tax=Dillenia turbinata TaxID=194707 RepID=A0AAN8UIE2_9MAGN